MEAVKNLLLNGVNTNGKAKFDCLRKSNILLL